MNKPLPTMQELAAEAEFQLLSAADVLNWLAALAAAIHSDHVHNKGRDAEHLAQLAKYLSDADSGGVRFAIEQFKQLSESAPQNPEVLIRGADNSGRVSLADFSAGRHTAAARMLGMTQGSLSKAIREGRSIYVTGNPLDGYAAVEEKPFPGQRRAVEVCQ